MVTLSNLCINLSLTSQVDPLQIDKSTMESCEFGKIEEFSIFDPSWQSTLGWWCYRLHIVHTSDLPYQQKLQNNNKIEFAVKLRRSSIITISKTVITCYRCLDSLNPILVFFSHTALGWNKRLCTWGQGTRQLCWCGWLAKGRSARSLITQLRIMRHLGWQDLFFSFNTAARPSHRSAPLLLSLFKFTY